MLSLLYLILFASVVFSHPHEIPETEETTEATIDDETTAVTIDETTTALILFGSCQSGWFRYNNYCYYYGRTLVTNDEATSLCQGLGATLAYFEDIQELEAVANHVTFLRFSWIGLKVPEDMREPVWSGPDGADIDSLPWLIPASGHGFTILRNCVAYYKGPIKITEYINYFNCILQFDFVCKKLVQDTSTPIVEIFTES